MYKIVKRNKIDEKREFIKNCKTLANVRLEVTCNIKRYRQELDLTQLELAEIVGITRQTLAVIERGEQVPNIVVCYLLARALKVPEKLLYSIKEVYVEESVICT